MSSSSTLVDDRPLNTTPNDDHPDTQAEPSVTPPGRPDSLPVPAVSRHGRSTAAGLYGVAVVAVIAAFVASIVFLVAYEPGGAEVTTMSWPAAAAAMVGLLSAVAGFVLAFLATFRNDSV